MCDISVMNSVKQTMLSRRTLFQAGAAAGAAAVLGGTGAAPALAGGHGKVVDMTHTLDEAFPTWGGPPGISYDQQFNFAEHGFNLFMLTTNEHCGTHIDAPTIILDAGIRAATNEHCGTHIDAPLHFSADGASVDAMPAENLVCPLVIVDIAARAAEDADAQVTPNDISDWVAANGPVPDGACIAMNSGWASRSDGDGFRNADDGGTMHFPGFHVEAASMLMEETGAVAIAVDTLSLDFGMSGDFATHYKWLPSGRYGIECVRGLDELPATGAKVFVGAPKIRGGTGGQARVIAMT